MSNDTEAEAKVVINGVELSSGQFMTLRVAIESFAGQLVNSKKDKEMQDAHGQRITQLYQSRLNEIRDLIYRK